MAHDPRQRDPAARDRAQQLSRAQKEDRARALLALVGLEGFEGKRPSELSGGMRQRASLCRAIAHKPDILIMDEPFGALDAFTREDLWQTMHRLRAEEPFTCMLITHDLRESIYLADETIVLSDRPATVQYRMDTRLDGRTDLEILFEQEAIGMLHTLRDQIKIAQGRAEPAPPDAKGRRWPMCPKAPSGPASAAHP